MSAQDMSQAQSLPGPSTMLQRLKRSMAPGLTQKTSALPVPPPAPVSAPEPTAAADPVAPIPMPADTLNVPYAAGGPSKEVSPIMVSVEHPAVDVAGTGVQAVEIEKAHELSPEVEGFLRTVEDNQDQIPQEVVLSNPQTGQSLPPVMAQPVIVLPITPEVEAVGRKKSTAYSIRWLVE